MVPSKLDWLRLLLALNLATIYGAILPLTYFSDHIQYTDACRFAYGHVLLWCVFGSHMIYLDSCFARWCLQICWRCPWPDSSLHCSRRSAFSIVLGHRLLHVNSSSPGKQTDHMLASSPCSALLIISRPTPWVGSSAPNLFSIKGLAFASWCYSLLWCRSVFYPRHSR